jgi:hypothetical protein
MPSVDPAHAVKLARIRMALRRATGQSFDVETLLTGPRETAAATIKQWRALGVAELDALLDQWLGAPPGALNAAPPPEAGAAAKAAPKPAAPAPPTPNPEPPVPPPDRRYLRGAR